MALILRFLAGILFLVGPTAAAHTLSVAHMAVDAGDPESPKIELDLALRDIALALPLDVNRDEQVTWGELLAVQDALEAMVGENVGISTRAGECDLVPLGLAVRQYDDGAYAALRLEARCPSQGELRVRYSLFSDVDRQHRVLITHTDGAAMSSAVAHAGAEVALGSAESHPFRDFLREGVHHILIGYDHLAFVLCLLLPAVLVRTANRWQPRQDLRSGTIQVLGILTAFTLAHSVTLSLAALGLVTPSTRWVEAAIAASVVLAALNNVWPVVTRRLWLVGFGFGLVHGFGFAGALGELGLPTGARLVALVGFNLGVEMGQVAVVGLVLPLLVPLRGRSWYAARGMPAISLAIALVAGYWLWERLFA